MNYTAIDFETGNASPLSACAIGVSMFQEDRLVREDSSLIRPPSCAGRFHWGNVRINGIREKMVIAAPPFNKIWRRFAADVEGSVIVCHNAAFDVAVLCACLQHYGLPLPHCRYVCTVKISQKVWPDLDNHKLNTVSDALGIKLNHHEAGSDARASGLILQAALRETHSKDVDELATAIGMQIGCLSPEGNAPCSIAVKKES